jgi:hypothetical protein
MIVPTIKFVLYIAVLHVKRVYGGGYLLVRKHQAYFVGNNSNISLTYLPIKFLTLGCC